MSRATNGRDTLTVSQRALPARLPPRGAVAAGTREVADRCPVAADEPARSCHGMRLPVCLKSNPVLLTEADLARTVACRYDHLHFTHSYPEDNGSRFTSAELRTVTGPSIRQSQSASKSVICRHHCVSATQEGWQVTR